MANVDRPNGFRAVKTLNGSPLTGMIRQIGVADSADIFRGDALETASGRAQVFTAGDECLGVAVGFGKVNALSGKYNAYDPTALDTPNYYDDSANTHTEWVCYYYPAENVVFEAQGDGSATTLDVGGRCDLTLTAGSTTTGISAHELNPDATTNNDVQVVEIPDIVGNDHTAANGRYWVIFTNTEMGATVT